MPQPAVNSSHPGPPGRWRFTYLLLGLSVAGLAVAYLYAAWADSREYETHRPKPAPEAIVAALRAFHQQTGRFPSDFRELDQRIWRGSKESNISPEGRGLATPVSHYYYTLHTRNPPPGQTGAGPPKAGLWAIPTGPRAQEAATYFLYVTPEQQEVWMGPALTTENVGALQSIPSEQQLALLLMTRQATPAKTGARQGLWPF